MTSFPINGPPRQVYTSQAEAILAAIRAKMEAHPALGSDDGLGRITFIVQMDERRDGTVREVFVKAEWKRQAR